MRQHSTNADGVQMQPTQQANQVTETSQEATQLKTTGTGGAFHYGMQGYDRKHSPGGASGRTATGIMGARSPKW